jgi:Putative Actinobacterial Holin-X, holin superfamily III
VSATEDEQTQEQEPQDEAPSITELLVRLGRDVSVLVFCEAHLAASRNMPEVRRTARDLAGVLVTALTFLTAFAFANVAALHGLATAMEPWLAALILCLVWLALGGALVLALMVRAGNVTGWRWWRVFSGGRDESLEDLERARAQAEEAVQETIALLAPALTIEIASASVGAAGDMAGDMAGDVVGAGESLLDTSDEIMEAITDDIPGGGVVNQVWGVALRPGRLGLRVAMTVLQRNEPE